jgi:hypothetical protein
MPVETELKSVSALRNRYEENNVQPNNNQTRSEKKSSACFQNLKRFSSSRGGALPLAVFYGVFIYYYVTFLILSPTKDIKDVKDEFLSLNRSSFFETDETHTGNHFYIPHSQKE